MADKSVTAVAPATTEQTPQTQIPTLTPTPAQTATPMDTTKHEECTEQTAESTTEETSVGRKRCRKSLITRGDQTYFQQNPVLTVVILSFTVLTGLFLYGLPFWSWLLNDALGQAEELCFADPAEITCAGGRNYADVAREQNRYTDDGVLYGCGCTEGILADWACAVDADSFSISLFIGTAPGTGMMAAFTSWPILIMWLFGAGAVDLGDDVKQKWIKYSLTAFQIFYGLFLINTVCVWEVFHFIVVVLFIICMIVHYVTVMITIGIDTFAGKLIACSLTVGSVAIVVGYFWPVGSDWWSLHVFWLAECTGLMVGFCIAPILMIVPHDFAVGDSTAWSWVLCCTQAKTWFKTLIASSAKSTASSSAAAPASGETANQDADIRV
eukprot:CAMPEP_0206606596 /NCGR_PEP_ID=MMETSP0325_2-20121206/51467_1 /ASSEMBLY_ACC=CAM_ASM_000347 /TAXON_ID=2866 /ORGANISM="Crypthecodinium cohnii, Strain Seligo" /LENGTH=382 /DNA_ID=CAMNT_0054123085 /DNA_START=101 /DNA_END=1249 /DNA_ORIENTATION=-